MRKRKTDDDSTEARAARIARGARLAALRETFGRLEGAKITQEAISKRSAGILDRTRVVRLETGALGATGLDSLRGLAMAYGVTSDDLADYLDGRIDAEHVYRLRSSVTVRIPENVAAAIRAHPSRWHAATLVRAADQVWHLSGVPGAGVEAFLDELEKGIPEPHGSDAERAAAQIKRRR